MKTRFSVASILMLAIAIELHRLGMHARASCQLAQSLLGEDLREASGEFVSITVDRLELDKAMQARLRDAAESIVNRTRGRPQRRA